MTKPSTHWPQKKKKKKSQNCIFCLLISGGEIRIKARNIPFILNIFKNIFKIKKYKDLCVSCSVVSDSLTCNKDTEVVSKQINKDIGSESPFLVSQVETAIDETRQTPHVLKALCWAGERVVSSSASPGRVHQPHPC